MPRPSQDQHGVNNSAAGDFAFVHCSGRMPKDARVGWNALASLCFIVVLLAFPLARNAASFLGLPRRFGGICALVVVLGVGLRVWGIVRQQRRLSNENAATSIPQSTRLRCVSPRSETIELGKVPELRFEARYHLVNFAREISLSDRVIAGVCGFALAPLAYVVAAHSRIDLPPTATIVYSISLALLVGSLLVRAMRPTCLKIVPGHLIIERASYLSDRRQSIDSFDLTRAKVTMDLVNRYVDLLDGRHRLVLSLVFLRDIDDFAYYLFLSAMHRGEGNRETRDSHKRHKANPEYP